METSVHEIAELLAATAVQQAEDTVMALNRVITALFREYHRQVRQAIMPLVTVSCLEPYRIAACGMVWVVPFSPAVCLQEP